VIGNWVFRVPFAWPVTCVPHADRIWVWVVLMLDPVAQRRDWEKRLGGIEPRASAALSPRS
jgi:hypothetical protein